ncbi:MAG: sterol desaturase family protein [Marinovum algicola]|uniref:sterol desaturase family protein n=1 Tax=Roseobacteraceae TaxID=2854170 RepID=UPI0032EF4368
MDDTLYGTRDKRGNWHPNEPLETGPLFRWPFSLRKFIAWLPGYFLPHNVIFMALGIGFWFWLTPSRETLETLSWGWALYILVRNALTVLVIYGALELWLYVKRAQNDHFKYNGKFPAEHPSDVFLFKSQNRDNILRTFGTGLPIWSAYEVLMLHAWANDFGLWTTFGDNPVWLVLFWLVIPLIHEAHFFCIHRLIHTPWLYKHVHSVHHNSINPSPWSSLSMHPVEHLLYWSDSLIHLILPSHPLLLLYHLHVTGTGAVVGHIGFDKIETVEGKAVDTHAYAHYLHHKYFEVNYGDGAVPLDKLFGTWHDGTKESDEAMKARFRAKKDRIKARKTATSAS